jgi:hypothetical protein
MIAFLRMMVRVLIYFSGSVRIGCACCGAGFTCCSGLAVSGIEPTG